MVSRPLMGCPGVTPPCRFDVPGGPRGACPPSGSAMGPTIVLVTRVNCVEIPERYILRIQ